MIRKNVGTNFLFRNIDGFVEDDPHSGLPASRVRGGAFVREVLLRVG